MRYLNAEEYAVEFLARRPAVKFNWASRLRSLLALMSALPRLRCPTISNALLLDPAWGDLRNEPPADGKVHCSSLSFRDQGIRRFPHAVVQKAIDVPLPQQEARSHRWTKRRVHDIFGFALDNRQGGGRRSAAKAGQLLQDRASRGGQEAQLAQHKIHDVVGVLFGAYPLKVPTPASSVTVESRTLRPQVQSQTGWRRTDFRRFFHAPDGPGAERAVSAATRPP